MARTALSSSTISDLTKNNVFKLNLAQNDEKCFSAVKSIFLQISAVLGTH